MKLSYRVIGDYPMSPFRMGDIIELKMDESVHILPHYRDSRGYYWFFYSFDKFPLLFSKVEWYNSLPVSDMPQYVQCIKNRQLGIYNIRKDECYKVIGISTKESGEGSFDIEEIVVETRNGTRGFLPSFFTPLTHDAYTVKHDAAKKKRAYRNQRTY